MNRFSGRGKVILRIAYATTFSLMILFSGLTVMAQSTSFTYQGKLSDTGNPASGSYDLQFTLWDSVSAGTQIGSTQTLSAVGVTNGIFTVTLDFGAGAFSGANRFLEIGTRTAGGGSFTILTPRQQITSTPYAIRSLNASAADSATTATNATQLGGVAASQYVQTNDTRLSDARPPTAGSANYIQNTTSQQAGANFNISGNGTAGGTLSANSLGLGTASPTARLSITGAGAFNAAGAARLDLFNTTANTGFLEHVTDAGLWQLATMSGAARVAVNQTGNVGIQTTTPSANLTVAQSGTGSGTVATTSGSSVVTGTNTQFTNTFQVGDSIAGTGIPAGSVVLSIASDTSLTMSNSALITQSGGTYFVGGSGPRMVVKGYGSVGIGTTSPAARLDIVGGPLWTSSGWIGSVRMGNVSALGWNSNAAGNNFGIGQTNGGLYFFRTQSPMGNTNFGTLYDLIITDGGLVGIGTGVVPTSTLTVNGCITATNVTPCSSDARLKQNIEPLSYGLRELLRLHPVRWQWKDARATQLNMGLVAQEVEPVLPELVLQNADTKGSLGLNYSGLIPVLVKGIQEQQTQIEKQQGQIAQQQRQIEQLMKEMKTLQARRGGHNMREPKKRT